jgi:hypothetical protein
MSGALARRAVWGALAGLVLTLVGPVSPARAFECLLPDSTPPIMYNFVMQPSPAKMGPQDVLALNPASVGARIDVVVEDRLHHVDEYTISNPNLIVNAVLEIDAGAVTEVMQPVSGRYGRIVQPVFAVIGFLDLSPGVHDIRVTAQDSCGNVGHREWRVFYTPGATATCENAPRGLCD